MHKIYSYILPAIIATAALSSCSNDTAVEIPAGCGIKVSMSEVSAKTSTKAAPADLTIPTASQFDLSIKSQKGTPIYSGAFTEELIPAAPGLYTVTATWGENPLIGIDAPYYVGTTQARVSANSETATEVDLPCKVDNALVSVRFGRDAEESERFDRFYSDAKLNVVVDGYSMSISKSDAGKSVYFRAGSTATLNFSGKLLKEGNRAVSIPLELPEGYPEIFEAADHAIVTLSLPDPESALAVAISKVEMKEATLDETIPLSWLPVPVATPVHQYNAAGELVGTDLNFSDGYPGMQWKAVITDNNENVVRSISGTGALRSLYAQNQEWPFLAPGKYKATYYIINDGSEDKASSREFMIGNPDLNVTLNGYTSYDLYLAGDIDGANACEGNKAYGLKASVNISNELLNNARYSKTMSCTFNGENVEWSGASVEVGEKTQKPRLNAYVLKGDVTFAGTTASNSKNFYLTGLPTAYGLPTQDGGWTGHGTVTWNDSDNGTPRIRLGQNTTSQPQYVDNANFGIPAGTWVTVDYDVIVHGATVATTFTLTVGSETMFEFRSSSGAGNSKDHPFRDGTSTKQLSEAATSVRANNSYGSGQTRSWVYALGYKYGNPQ